MDDRAVLPLGPVVPDEALVASWDRTLARRVRSAERLAYYLPRGKGRVPRWIGRALCRDLRTSIRTAGGALLAIDPSNLDIYTSILSAHGKWDDHVLRVCKHFLTPGDVFYDIGANAGIILMEVANHFRCAVKTYGFEPQPSLALAAAVSARLNGLECVAVFECLLGDTEGQAQLFIPRHAIHASTISRERGARSLSCRVTTIDHQVQLGTIEPPVVMKVDVEGAELTVFRGARETIRAHTPVIVFEADENMNRFGHTRKTLLDFLRSLAPYVFYCITDEGLARLPAEGNCTAYPDLVAITEETHWQ